ncbi:hypothetical protein HKX48_001085 [Thoreauomyces humboldtii]|nr:hypothetical protein HKX48_001085 [Thoreauomyces humboldtii]
MGISGPGQTLLLARLSRERWEDVLKPLGVDTAYFKALRTEKLNELRQKYVNNPEKTCRSNANQIVSNKVWAAMSHTAKQFMESQAEAEAEKQLKPVNNSMEGRTTHVRKPVVDGQALSDRLGDYFPIEDETETASSESSKSHPPPLIEEDKDARLFLTAKFRMKGYPEDLCREYGLDPEAMSKLKDETFRRIRDANPGQSERKKSQTQV